MNYLAHLFLAGKSTELIIGNVLEDFVVGNIENERNAAIPFKIKQGIEMHRMIDHITDTDLNVKVCKKIFYDKFGKYSPIITDVLFDHFLILNWDKYSKESFEDFRPRVYAALAQYQEIQPEKMIAIIKSMKKNDWLKNYSEIWGLERAFDDLNSRIKQPNIDLKQSISIFQENYEILNTNFQLFFEKLFTACNQFIQKSENE